MPRSGSCLALACRFSKRSGSGESIQPCRRHQRCLAPRVSLLTLCPLGQPKKAIGHESFQKPWIADSGSFRNDQLKAKLLCPFGERSDLLLAILGFIIFGAFVNIRLAVFDEPVEQAG